MTHTPHFGITVCCTQFKTPHADAELCKHTRKQVSVTYKNTIRYSCVDSATNLLPNANNIQQGHFLELQRRTMDSLSRLCFIWYSPLGTLVQNYTVHQLQNSHCVLIRTIFSGHFSHRKQSTGFSVRSKLNTKNKVKLPSQKGQVSKQPVHPLKFHSQNMFKWVVSLLSACVCDFTTLSARSLLNAL